MNKEIDYGSDSDESDEDFCPGNENEADSSEEEDAAESDDENDGDDVEAEADAGASKKRTKSSKGRKKDKVSVKSVNESSELNARSTRQTEAKQNERVTGEKDELESDEEVDKSRSDALWADFLGDVGDSSKPQEKPKVSSVPAQPTNGKHTTTASKPATENLDFFGEPLTASKTATSSNSSAKENQKQPAAASVKPVTPQGLGGFKRAANGGGGGMGSFLNQLGKKKKMSVLEKSQLDWKTFKNDEGIDEELRTHNKGKDGFLERQDFLQRTDLRQFEIEKDLRQARRKN